MGQNKQMQQIDLVRWRGRDIPVKVQIHEGQPMGLPMILFDDMPLAACRT